MQAEQCTACAAHRVPNLQRAPELPPYYHSEHLSTCSARLSSGSTASLPPACASMPRACEADCSTEPSAEAPKGSRTKLAKLVSLIVDFRSVGDLAGPQGALFRG